MRLLEFIKSKTFLKHIIFIILIFGVLVYFTLFLLKFYTHHGETLTVPDFKGLPLEEAGVLAKESKLRFKIIDSIYYREAIPGTIIDQYPVAGYKAKQKRMIFFTTASFTPEKVVVPKVIDVSFREAQSRLEIAGLKTGQLIYRPSEFLNLVLEQQYNGLPLPEDTLLPKGTAIDLVIGKGLSNERTVVPDLMFLGLDEAKVLLYDLNLNIGALVYDESVQTYQDTLYARIWKQLPEPSTEELVELGFSIDLWLTVDEEKLFLTTEEPIEDF
ncbi:MAG: PASTA domain-containing protein [Prolixibacteraceae bacterium]|nr:PASTA domain-containing protein [Prolixibacteraceae bacterium]